MFSKRTDGLPWDTDAEEAVGKAPFFVRSKIKAKVEEFCIAEGKKRVTLDIVNRAKNNFTAKMHEHIKGYQTSSCFSSSGCPNRIMGSETLMSGLEEELKNFDFLGFLKSKTDEPLKFHHEFRLTIADCPNSCSQPQIADFGVIAASVPKVLEAHCTLCEACVSSCPDKAITLDYSKSIPVIDFTACQKCGICSGICTFGEIAEGQKGYRILLGGRLGRHPRLGMELPGIFTESETLSILKWCLEFYRQNCREAKRFSHILDESDFIELARKIDRGDFSS